MTYVFPFIVGSPRSGTTLLRAMFDSYFELHDPPQSYFIVGLHSQFDDPHHRLDMDAFLTALAHDERLQRWGIHEDEVAAALDRSKPATYADAIRTVYQLYAQRVGKPRFGDKTPRYSIDIPLLAALFREAVFIHIIRDGRDVALSLMDVRLGQGHVREAAVLWRDRVETARGSGVVLGPERYREIRYEELVEEPEPALRSLCTFVQIDFEPGMLDYSEHVRAMPDPALGVRYRPRDHTRLALPPTKGLRDWRTQMSTRDLAVFEANAGDLLSELGYERGCAHIPLHTSIGQRANDIAATTRSSMGAAARRLVAHNS